MPTVPFSPESAAVRAKIAGTARHHPGVDISALRAELAEQRREDYIVARLREGPPLDAERRLRIAAILFAPTADGGASDG